MDYYSKYKKYKLKFLNLRKQIGGAVIWQCEISPGNWINYNHADSQIIENGHGTFQLPNERRITKTSPSEGVQIGLKNKRAIRRIIIEDKTVAQKLLETVRAFPVIFTYRGSSDFRTNLSTIFGANAPRINHIWGMPDSFETVPRGKSDLFQEIITNTDPGMTDEALLKFIEGMLKRIEDEGKAEVAADLARQREEEEERKKFKGL